MCLFGFPTLEEKINIDIDVSLTDHTFEFYIHSSDPPANNRFRHIRETIFRLANEALQ